MGIVVGIVGAVVLAVAALADSLGIGEGHTFGWLQTLGVVLGALILLIGLAIVVGWIPTRRKTVVTSGSRRHDHHDGGRGVAARGGAASPRRRPDPAAARALPWARVRLPEGVSAMLAMSVRMFLIAIVVLGIATVAFLIATA